MAKRNLEQWIEEGRQAIRNNKRDMTAKELKGIVEKWGGYHNLQVFYCLDDIFCFGVKIGMEQAKAEKRKAKKSI